MTHITSEHKYVQLNEHNIPIIAETKDIDLGFHPVPSDRSLQNHLEQKIG